MLIQNRDSTQNFNADPDADPEPQQNKANLINAVSMVPGTNLN
jgi:hypothetical protein